MKELLEYIYHGKEERNLEYKQSMAWGESSTKEKLTKAALAMSNLKEGGVIVVGVKENADGSFEPVGMDSNDLIGYRADLIIAHINKYAEPYVELTINKVVDEEKKFVVIQVAPFQEIPTICKKGSNGLKSGKLYIRSRRMNETTESLSQTDMREIIDIAVDKNIEKFRQRFYSVFPNNSSEIETISSNEFDEELGEF